MTYISGIKLINLTIMEMNRLQIKALLLSVITELQFGQPLAPNGWVKAEYKKAVGLAKNASNKVLLANLQVTYKDNNLEREFMDTIKKFKAEEYLRD